MGRFEVGMVRRWKRKEEGGRWTVRKLGGLEARKLGG
jgi:hypothetical protein